MNGNLFNGGFPVQKLNVAGGFGAGPRAMNDSAVSGGMAMLVGELEKRDPKLHEPLTSTTWPRDIVTQTGGGYVDYASTTHVAYGTTGGNEAGIIGGQTNNIPVVQADIGKDVQRVFTWANIMLVPFVDQQKMQGIGRSLDELLDKGIRLNYDKTMDQNVYTGFPTIGTYGLVNSPNIAIGMAPSGAGGSTKWFQKEAEEILRDVNSILTHTWGASEYDLSGMANHILLPPEHYSYIVEKTVSVAGVAGPISILNYLLENNIGKNQGRALFIAPCIQCVGAGEGGLNRMVAYANDEDRVRFQTPVPLSRVLTQTSVDDMGYKTAYTGQFSELQWVYETHAKYMDGI